MCEFTTTEPMRNVRNDHVIALVIFQAALEAFVWLVARMDNLAGNIKWITHRAELSED